MAEYYYKVPAIHEYQEIEEEPKEDTVFEDTVVCSLCRKEVLLTDATFDTKGNATCKDCQKDIEEVTFLDSRETEVKEPVKEDEKEKEPKRELISIRPDIPPGIGYVGKLIDDNTYLIKTDKPIRSLEKQEVRQADEVERRETKGTKRLAEISTIDSLKNSFSRGVR